MATRLLRKNSAALHVLWAVLLCSAMVIGGCSKDKKDKQEDARTQVDSTRYKLSLGLEKGKTYLYDISTTLKVKLEDELSDDTMDVPPITLSLREELVVQDDSEEDLTIDATLNNLELDSKEIDVPQTNAFLQTLDDVVFTFAISPEGKVRNLQGITNWLNQIGTASMDDPDAINTLLRLKKFLVDNRSKNQFSFYYNFLPDKKVKTGATWSKYLSVDISSSDRIDIETNYKLEIVEKIDGARCAVISFSMGGDYPKGLRILEDLKEESGSDYWIKRLKIDGEIILDLDNNVLKKAKLKVDQIFRIITLNKETGEEDIIIQNIISDTDLSLASEK